VGRQDVESVFDGKSVKSVSRMRWTISNFLSLLRGPLALCFLSGDFMYRSFAIAIAMATDFLDGYLARRFNQVTQFGAFLDPLMDKFFVLFAMTIFLLEGQLTLWKCLALMSRDFAVLIFGFYLVLRGKWSRFQFRSIWSGKISTTVQFFVLFSITYQVVVPSYVFVCLVMLGIFALAELYFGKRSVC
jgi:CDP-diacylglycerol---glycerol-3-phosphate 3-phosphatidyltransferase